MDQKKFNSGVKSCKLDLQDSWKQDGAQTAMYNSTIHFKLTSFCPTDVFHTCQLGHSTYSLSIFLLSSLCVATVVTSSCGPTNKTVVTSSLHTPACRWHTIVFWFRRRRRLHVSKYQLLPVYCFVEFSSGRKRRNILTMSCFNGNEQGLLHKNPSK